MEWFEFWQAAYKYHWIELNMTNSICEQEAFSTVLTQTLLRWTVCEYINRDGQVSHNFNSNSYNKYWINYMCEGPLGPWHILHDLILLTAFFKWHISCKPAHPLPPNVVEELGYRKTPSFSWCFLCAGRYRLSASKEDAASEGNSFFVVFVPVLKVLTVGKNQPHWWIMT